jgi:hypothetical protein
MSCERARPWSRGIFVAIGVGVISVVAFVGDRVAIGVNVVKVAVVVTEKSLKRVVRDSVEFDDWVDTMPLEKDVSWGACCDETTDTGLLPVPPELSGIACRWTTSTCELC